MRPILLLGALFVSTLPAYAGPTVTCGQILGYDACVTDNEVVDRIVIIGPAGGERITLNCSDGGWNSNGPNTQEFVQSIVNNFCN